MSMCTVLGCNSHSKQDSNLKFHRLRVASKAEEHWIRLLGHRPEPSQSYIKICSRHFEPHCYNHRGNTPMLSKDAVPTLFLPPLPPEKTEENLAACRVCLSTDTLLYGISETGMESAFAKFTGVSLSPLDGLPSHLCYLCRAQLSKGVSFRDRCQRSQKLLATLKEKRAVTSSEISAINRHTNKLTLNLTLKKVYNFNTNQNEISTNVIETEKNISIITIDGTETESKICKNVDKDFEFKVKEESSEEHGVKLELERHKDDIDTGKDLKGDITVEISKPTKNANFISISERMTDSDDEVLSKLKNDKESDLERKKSVNKRKLKKNCKNKTAKSTKNVSGNTELHFMCKRKIIGDEAYPDFDYEAFEKEYNVNIKLLTKDEQRKEIELLKANKNYLKMPYRCEMCGKGYNHEDTYKNHMSYHDPNLGPLECAICHFRFNSQWRLLRHSDNHRISFTCVECGHVSRGQRAFARRHRDVHLGVTYPCPHCDKAYARKTAYFDHVRMSHPALNVACDQCGETFLSRRGVTNHKALAHRQNTKTQQNLKCSCGVEFSNSSALSRHKSTATDAAHASCKPCASCGENCRDDEALAAHAAECGRGQLHCDECELTFSGRCSFELHQRRKHLGQRKSLHRAPSGRRQRYAGVECVCELCGKILKNKLILRNHLRAHGGLKPFSCAKCDKAFADKLSLTFHMRTHTGERPHRCRSCPLAFAHQSNLIRHNKVVHLGQRKTTPCGICGKLFTTPSCAKLHIDKVHNKMPWPKRNRQRKETKKETEQVKDVSSS